MTLIPTCNWVNFFCQDHFCSIARVTFSFETPWALQHSRNFQSFPPRVRAKTCQNRWLMTGRFGWSPFARLRLAFRPESSSHRLKVMKVTCRNLASIVQTRNSIHGVSTVIGSIDRARRAIRTSSAPAHPQPPFRQGNELHAMNRKTRPRRINGSGSMWINDRIISIYHQRTG